MIKRLLIALVAVIGMSAAAAARDTYAHDASVLPKAAQTTLSQNFKAHVSVVKIDKDFGRISDYEVILTDGTEITFDRDGNWENVEVSVNGTIPSAFIPSSIADYVRTNMSGQKIVGIEKERTGYDIELANGVDMKFDKNGQFRPLRQITTCITPNYLLYQRAIPGTSGCGSLYPCLPQHVRKQQPEIAVSDINR